MNTDRRKPRLSHVYVCYSSVPSYERRVEFIRVVAVACAAGLTPDHLSLEPTHVERRTSHFQSI